MVSSASAQTLKRVGKSGIDVAPNGWKVEEYKGDLNRDGVRDMVVVATPNLAEKLIIREDDGYVFDCNAPVLAIYWGVPAGKYYLYKEYRDIIPHREDEFMDVEVATEITNRGTIKFTINTFASAGSAYTGSYKYVFRYQNEDFFRIGYESDYFSRMSGDGKIISINYSTRKRQIKTYNAFDEGVAQTETWESIPSKPLERLGARYLEQQTEDDGEE